MYILVFNFHRIKIYWYITFATHKNCMHNILKDKSNRNYRNALNFYYTNRSKSNEPHRLWLYEFRKENYLLHFLCTVYTFFSPILHLLLLFHYIVKLFFGSSQQPSIVASSKRWMWMCVCYFLYMWECMMCTLSSFSTKWNVCTSELTVEPYAIYYDSPMCVTIQESHRVRQKALITPEKKVKLLDNTPRYTMHEEYNDTLYERGRAANYIHVYVHKDDFVRCVSAVSVNIEYISMILFVSVHAQASTYI